MIVSTERCSICGEIHDFVLDDGVTLLREARCKGCGASIRNSDTAAAILEFLGKKSKALVELSDKDLDGVLILNTCSSGSIHNALKRFPGYICSEYFRDVPNGEFYEGIMSVELSKIPFPDNSLDLIISEDVFEHVENYECALSEIYRVLKPKGEHIFTVPIHDGKKTESRKKKRDVFHGDPNPESGGAGVLVYTDWGEDITDIVANYGFETEIIRGHCFYGPNEVTDVDSDYDEYFKHLSNLEYFFKYNSYVLRCKKADSNEKTNTMDYTWYYILALNKNILSKNEKIRVLDDDNVARGNHILLLDKEIDIYRKRITELESECMGLKAQNDKLVHKMDSLKKILLD